MTQQTEALRLAAALDKAPYSSPCTNDAAAELRRLEGEIERKSDAIQRLWKERDDLRAVNAQLLEALEWIANRCPEQMLKQPLHTIHQEAVYDAGACARAAIAAAKVEA
jgi:hypothetical protein